MHEAEKIIPAARREESDVGEGFVWASFFVLLGSLVAIVLATWWLFPQSPLDRTIQLPLPTYPAPRLQASPREDMQTFHAQEMQRLNSTGWIDKARGVVHIPIADAMRKITQQGIPRVADAVGEAAMNRLLALGLLTLAAFSSSAGTAAAGPADPTLFSYRQRTGSSLPLESRFRDSNGRLTRLGDFQQGKPMILVLGYFHCPNLCGIVRADLYHALGATKLRAGRDYSLTVVSIDPHETTSDAKAAKAEDDAAYALPGADKDWRYLTGSAENIQAVADAVGFRDQLDQQTKLFIHPAGIVFVSPAGVISSYLLGVGYAPVEIRAAVERASVGRIATAASPILLLCFHFDPTNGRYTLEIMKLLRLGGALTIVVVAGMLFLLFRRDGRQA